MIPADILLALFVVLVVAAAWTVLAGLGAKIAQRRQALLEPETHGDMGGWPVNDLGYPTMFPTNLAEYGPYEAALNRYFAKRGDDMDTGR